MAEDPKRRIRIYLDNCCYNRPYDDQTQIRIYLETQAVLHIQSWIGKGYCGLAWSYILDYENRYNPYRNKRLAIIKWKELAEVDVSEETEMIIWRAQEIVREGAKKYDALHIACAIEGKCDYFITTDKKLIKMRNPEIAIINPINFTGRMENIYEN